MKICYLPVGLGISQAEIAKRKKILNRIAGLPLVNPIVTAVKMAEALVAMRGY